MGTVSLQRPCVRFQTYNQPYFSSSYSYYHHSYEAQSPSATSIIATGVMVLRHLMQIENKTRKEHSIQVDMHPDDSQKLDLYIVQPSRPAASARRQLRPDSGLP
eukprot:GHVT01103713.1.p2 GENE.GHVT01103713.1~~GHVT01103713.1.p2  ORF type:complete len:104 (+),score=9.75 GHVT01103713.1:1204-1515(+)